MVIGSGGGETTQGKDQDKENFIPLSSLADLTGWVVAPLIYASMAGRPAISISNGPAMLVAAGLLVGYGTRLGGGCTSGHGVCGLARLSKRSMTATAIFMVAAAGTVFVTRHVIAG